MSRLTLCGFELREERDLRKPSTTPVVEYFGMGDWEGEPILLHLYQHPVHPYWIALVEADKRSASTRYFRLSAHGEDPGDAIRHFETRFYEAS